MNRVFSITENPIVWGIRHRTLADTNKNCGKPIAAVSEYTQASRPVADWWTSEAGQPISNWWVDGYRLGRAIRFCITVPLALADIVLQIFQIIAHTFETLALRLDQIIRCKTDPSPLFRDFYLTNLIYKIRKLLTRDDYRHFFTDLGCADGKPFTITHVWRSIFSCLPGNR